MFRYVLFALFHDPLLWMVGVGHVPLHCSTEGWKVFCPYMSPLNREFPFKMVLKSRKGCVSLPKNWWTNMNKLFSVTFPGYVGNFNKCDKSETSCDTERLSYFFEVVEPRRSSKVGLGPRDWEGRKGAFGTDVDVPFSCQKNMHFAVYMYVHVYIYIYIDSQIIIDDMFLTSTNWVVVSELPALLFKLNVCWRIYVYVDLFFEVFVVGVNCWLISIPFQWN